MEAVRIVELLKEKGVTQARIADDLKVRQPAVNQVIHGRQTSRKIQDRICEVIGHSFEEVFGK